MTAHSAACDLFAREGLVISPQKVAKVPVGVWIQAVDWSKVPENFIPELQIRARSGLSFKHSIIHSPLSVYLHTLSSLLHKTSPLSQLSTINYQLFIVNYQLLTIN